IPDPGLNRLSDDELTILLILGENAYHPTAIRCAAQLARSSRIDPHRLAALAVQHKAVRVLTHISRAGLAHDPEGRNFWITVLSNLPATQAGSEPDLPHWSRFVSMPGMQKSGPAVTRWLTPIT
ncbi:MAG: hypothetical protein NTV46_03765, partial [Verrucomicrobia bacterium]|nr:hypothetical protein [Verrucomicrobiota bacterium]